ncbi:MAG: PSD1 and planctomycete cytochrome C domain-containing protein, partial [Pirellulales bacterium]|nr:PSD1 and planctomycete cytochrome C domain-containing protein [Pirellulales bacterium]
MTRRRTTQVVAGLFACLVLLSWSNVYGAIQFNRDIRPILSAHCYHCHGPDKKHRRAELRLDQPDGIADAFGETDLADNEAWQRMVSTDPEEQMPPPTAHTKLKPVEFNLLKQWIAEGAKYEGHWAFVTPTKPETPKVSNPSWVRSPIDTFVMTRLDAAGLKPNSEATREQLIRRLTLDLTGLPPTVAEVDAFLADKSTDAYAKVVDRLLASPRFGERLAVPWLDAARFADTNGFSIDDHRDMWLWREWVIDAVNRNMPYDQFLVEQLAGDLLPNATNSHRLATGFLRNSMNTHEGGTIPAEYRVIYIADKVDTVSTVFMGLTMRCAQCHNHKYDPISQQDYYKFYAFFDTAHEPGMGAHNGNTAPIQRMDGLVTSATTFKADVEKRIATLRRYLLHPPELIKARAAWEAKAAASARGQLASAIATPAAERSDQQWSTINAAFAKTSQLWNRHISTIKREIAVLENDRKAGKASVMVMKEKGPRQTYVLTRGQYDLPDKSQPVATGVPAVLPKLNVQNGAKATRLDLARWLTAPDHPLTARVAVNRYWQMLFGRGLVATPNDFGSQGTYPSHPALLDW